MLSRARARAAAQDGFTLMELLVAMSVGMVVLFALFQLLDFSLPAAANVAERVSTQQRGRVALTQVEQSLHSAVCVLTADASPAGSSSLKKPIVSASPQQVTFYATELAPAQTLSTPASAFSPQLRTLSWSAGTLTQSTGAPVAGTAPPNVTWQAPVTRIVATGIWPVGAASGIFTASAYDAATGALVPAADATKAASIGIAFRVTRSETTAASPQDATFSDAVTLTPAADFTSDNAASDGPKCSL